MTRARRAPRQRKQAPKGVLTKPRSVRFVTVMAFVLPGSGQVFNGAPARGVIMQAGMVFGAFITYMLTTPDISPVGRMAGGLLMYVFSIVDANGIAKLRVHAWERMQAGGPGKRAEIDDGEPAGATRSRGKRKKGVAAPVDPGGRPAEEPPAESGGSPEPSATSAEPASSERPSG